MKNNLPAKQSNFLLYTGNDGKVNIEVFLQDETIWLTQKAISELYGVQRPAITKHLKNIFDSGELQEDSVSSILEHTASDGKKYKTKFYNLDAIISVGYRVNSYQATQFRIWATRTLKEFIIKGFILDDKRLKQGNQVFGKDYFDELLERIREIRASERRFYQKITESEIEKFAIELLEKQGYQYIYAPSIAPDLSAPSEARQAGSDSTGTMHRAPTRQSFEDVLLMERLQSAVGRINPSIPADIREDAIKGKRGQEILMKTRKARN